MWLFLFYAVSYDLIWNRTGPGCPTQCSQYVHTYIGVYVHNYQKNICIKFAQWNFFHNSRIKYARKLFGRNGGWQNLHLTGLTSGRPWPVDALTARRACEPTISKVYKEYGFKPVSTANVCEWQKNCFRRIKLFFSIVFFLWPTPLFLK
jgi:hypothetical protein